MNTSLNKLSSHELIQHLKKDPVGVQKVALENYINSKSNKNNTSDSLGALETLYMIQVLIHDYRLKLKKNKHGSLVHHPSRQFNKALEKNVSIKTSGRYETIYDYIARLSNTFASSSIPSLGEYWKAKQDTITVFLEPDKIDNFKRTYGHSLSNFIPSVKSHSHHLRGLIEFLMDARDYNFTSDDVEPFDADHAELLKKYITTFNFRTPAKIRHETYAMYTSLLWRKAIFHDENNILSDIHESLIGNPYRIRRNGTLISQDLARSSAEFNIITKCINRDSLDRILEIGAGYGRLCELFIQKGTKQYIIVDIFPSIYLAEQYLKARFPDLNVFSLKKFDAFESIEQELNNSRIILLSPHQLSILPEKWIGTSININSFMEMSFKEVEWYFSEINRICSGFLYTKQWFENKNKPGTYQFNRSNYPVPHGWKKLIDRTDPLNTDFFEQIWSVS